MKKNRYCFDIDGTICTNTDGEYQNAIPYADRIQKIRSLILDGNEVFFMTARGSETGIDWSDLTTNQLREWGLPESKIFFGKPSADFYVDDKATNVNDFFL